MLHDHGLTICNGLAAVVGAVQDGLTGDTPTLLAKAILFDMVIIVLDLVSKGKGAIFAVVSSVPSRSITLLAHLIAPIMTHKPFRICPSRVQPHSLCRNQSHLGQTNCYHNLLSAVLIAIIGPLLLKLTVKDWLAFYLSL